jgi:hypothetical protein
VNETVDVAALVAAYDVTESTTHYMTATCHADYRNGNLVIVCPEGRDISSSDWSEVLDRFDFHPEFFTMDFRSEDGLDLFLLRQDQ